MPSTLLATTLMIALGQMPGGPYDGGGADVYPAPDNGAVVNGAPVNGAPVNGAAVNGAAVNGAAVNGAAVNGGYEGGGQPVNGYFANAYGNYRMNPAMQPVSPGGGPVTDPYLNYDAYEPWVHGYWQELPAYGGFTYFRPYNYRHVYVQSEVAASWGTSAQMPYSQEYFRRAREQGILEQRTTSTGRTGLPFVYRQRPRTNRQHQPEIIAKASAERPAQQRPVARQPSSAARGPLFPSR
jgi:hypothetical protein